MTDNDRKFKKEALDWLLQSADSYTHAVTLTLKPYRIVLTENGQMREVLTRYEATRNFSYFLRRLNASLFGNSPKRYGKSISVLPMLEGEANQKLLHYHCALGNFPASLTEDEIQTKIVTAWHQTPFGNVQTDVQKMHTSGWLTYVAKELGRKNVDVIDLENMRQLPAASLT